jgi:hypothetical protein
VNRLSSCYINGSPSDVASPCLWMCHLQERPGGILIIIRNYQKYLTHLLCFCCEKVARQLGLRRLLNLNGTARGTLAHSALTRGTRISSQHKGLSIAVLLLTAVSDTTIDHANGGDPNANLILGNPGLALISLESWSTDKGAITFVIQ